MGDKRRKLTDAQKVELVALALKKELTQREIAKLYGIGEPYVSTLVNRAKKLGC